jgi:hypothetical protein
MHLILTGISLFQKITVNPCKDLQSHPRQVKSMKERKKNQKQFVASYLKNYL